ncbi:hypothetical protein ACF061_01135 [Streptomyces sp. NPDC015220]|uniref:hypothetical protein n=1 Tax=Streptomyces sp. NPDC015220 TaxID=3364947 RepID=UPI0036FD9C83
MPSSQTLTGQGAHIVIDQSKVRVVDELIQRGAPGFPRSLTWWRRNVPLWLDVTENEQGHIVLQPNGHQADGTVLEVTPALRRRHIRYAHDWVGSRVFLDLSDAIVAETVEGGAR